MTARDQRVDVLIIGESGRLAKALAVSAQSNSPNLVVKSLGRASGMDLTQRTETRRLIRQLNPKVVINTAAVTSVDSVEAQLCHAVSLNALGAGVVAQCCRENNADLIHVSTDYVYDGKKGAAYVEGDTENPLNMYGRSKFLGDQLIRSILPEATIIRTAWLFDANDGSFFSKVIEHIDERKCAKGATDQMGCPTYLPSLADALMALVEALLLGKTLPTTLHLAGRGEATRFDVVSRIARAYSALTGSDVMAEEALLSDWGTTTNRPLDTRLDISLASSLGISLSAWQNGVDRAVKDWVLLRYKDRLEKLG